MILPHSSEHHCSLVLWDPRSRAGLRYRSALWPVCRGLGSPFQNRAALSSVRWWKHPDRWKGSYSSTVTTDEFVEPDADRRGRRFKLLEKALFESKYLNRLLMVSAPFTTLWEKTDILSRVTKTQQWLGPSCSCRMDKKLLLYNREIWSWGDLDDLYGSIRQNLLLPPLWSRQLNYPDCFLFEFIRSSVYATAFSVIPKSSAPPSHLSPPPFCWQRCGRGSLLAERLFIWTAEWWPVCCGHRFPSPPPGLRRGFSQFAIAKVGPIWSAAYVPGVPFFPEAPLLNTFPNTGNGSLLPTSIHIPANRQHVRNALPVCNRGRRTKEQLDWFSCWRCHTY